MNVGEFDKLLSQSKGTATYHFQELGKRFKICTQKECGSPAAWIEANGDSLCEDHMDGKWKAFLIEECCWEGCKKKSIKMNYCSEHQDKRLHRPVMPTTVAPINITIGKDGVTDEGTKRIHE